MKKLIAAVLLAVAGTVAQAVTLDWTCPNLKPGSAYSLVVTLTDTRLNEVIVEAFGWKDDTKLKTGTLMSVGASDNPFTVGMTRYGKWEIVPSLGNSTWTTSNVKKTVGGGDIKSIVMTLSGTAQGDKKLDHLTFEFKSQAKPNGSCKFIADDTTASVDLSSGSVTLFGGKDDLTSSYSASAELQLLPEPTVLALLALGVAGLALKRRTPSDAA